MPSYRGRPCSTAHCPTRACGRPGANRSYGDRGRLGGALLGIAQWSALRMSSHGQEMRTGACATRSGTPRGAAFQPRMRACYHGNQERGEGRCSQRRCPSIRRAQAMIHPYAEYGEHSEHCLRASLPQSPPMPFVLNRSNQCVSAFCLTSLTIRRSCLTISLLCHAGGRHQSPATPRPDHVWYCSNAVLRVQGRLRGARRMGRRTAAGPLRAALDGGTREGP